MLAAEFIYINCFISCFAEMATTKTVKRLDLFVVENHDEVLEPLYRKIGSKKLPFEGMCMLHFDSHSDLSVPKELTTCANGTLSKHEVFRYSSIESWIIPAIYSGHINSVFWLHPHWTKQSFPSESLFKVGRCMEDNSLKVTSASNHFLSEDSFDHEDHLIDLKEVQLLVREINPLSKFTDIVEELRKTIETQENVFILDIDLDFFSTKDPFMEMLRPEVYEFLRRSYEFVPPLSQNIEDVIKCMSDRRGQLKHMKSYFASLSGPDDRTSSDLFRFCQDYDRMWLHEIGTGIDDCPLPHHVSTEEVIDQLVCSVERLLAELPNPSVIFVSRSSEDDYCPSEQVEMIQVKVLQMCDRLYKDVKKTFLYEK